MPTTMVPLPCLQVSVMPFSLRTYSTAYSDLFTVISEYIPLRKYTYATWVS